MATCGAVKPDAVLATARRLTTMLVVDVPISMPTLVIVLASMAASFLSSIPVADG